MLRIFLKLFNYLPKKQRRSLYFLAIAMVLGGAFEAISLGSFIPFLAFLSGNNEKISPLAISFYQAIPIDSSLVVKSALLFVLITILSGALRLFTIRETSRTSARIGSELSTKSYSNNLSQSYSYHISRDTNKIINSAILHVDRSTRAVSCLLLLLASIASAVFLLSGLLIYNTPQHCY